MTDYKYKIVLYNTEGEGTLVEEQTLKACGIDSYSLIRIDGDKDEAFMKESADADGIVIVYTQMTKERMEKFTKCQAITTHTIGMNQVDLKAASDLGICIGNCPDYCVEEVAVHTLALLLDSVRKISQHDRAVKSGNRELMSAGKMYRTKGKSYGLVSFGNIPRRVSELLQPFGLSVYAYDPFVPDEVFAEKGVTRLKTLEELFKTCDYISVHSPLLPQTRHMIGKDLFDAAKPGCILIATGRGGVIDEPALKEALESGKINAAGIDVIEDEDAGTSVLTGLTNVTLTPHSAYYSEDSCDEVRQKAITQIVDVLVNKKAPAYLVNKDVLGHARFEK